MWVRAPFQHGNLGSHECICPQLKKEERGGGGVVSRLTNSLQSWMMSFIQAHGFGGILLLVRLRIEKCCCCARQGYAALHRTSNI